MNSRFPSESDISDLPLPIAGSFGKTSGATLILTSARRKAENHKSDLIFKIKYLCFQANN